MPITIPSSVSQAYDDLIKRGLSTDEYSYLVLMLQKQKPMPQKGSGFMKVYVPEIKKNCYCKCHEGNAGRGIYNRAKTIKRF